MEWLIEGSIGGLSRAVQIREILINKSLSDYGLSYFLDFSGQLNSFESI